MSIKSVLTSFKTIDRQMKRNIERAAKMSAQLILDESNRRVPVDTGRLRNSGRVIKESYRAYSVGYPVHYGVYVHFDATAYHPNGEAFFLHNAIMAKRQEVLKIFARELKI
jgi:hypothetical protein